MIKYFVLYMILFIVLPDRLISEDLVIVHPRPESELDKRYFYHWEILEASLEATKEEGSYVIEEADSVMSENRTFHELLANSGKIDIIRDNCSKKMEEYLLPIKIPLLKGALGWRVFIINKELKEELAAVSGLDDLKNYTIGAGQGWGNIPLLQAAGFKVITGSSYEALFSMANYRRFDLYDRSIIEAPIELAERSGRYPDLSIDEKIILKYPILDYFYVNKADKKLAARIERGLRIIIENGLLDEIFEKYYWDSLKTLDLDSRIIFEIENPDLGELPDPDRWEFWLEDFLDKKNGGVR